MKLVQFDDPELGVAPGVQLPDGGVVPLTAALGASAPSSVSALLSAGPQAMQDLQRKLPAALSEAIPASRVRLVSPLGTRLLMVCAGANYRAHVEEMGDELPEKAAWFIKSSNSIIGPGADIELPSRAPDRVDWEGELCVVIAKPCFSVRAEDAWDYVAGFTLLNDVSARDGIPAIQGAETALEGRWAWTDMLLGKQFPTFAPLGPAVVTTDEAGDVDSIRLTTTLNGEIMQDTLIGDLAVGIPALIEQFSQYFCFQAGDVISTGTPAGVGDGRNPPIHLRDGDEVVVAATGIGELSNRVVGGRPTSASF